MKLSNEKKRVFVLRYEGDVMGVFDSEKDAECILDLLVASQDEPSDLDLWLIEETTYYYRKENT